MKCKKLIGVLVFAFVMGLSLPVSAAILFDDFDDDSGILTGQTAVTGQTWLEISGRTSLDIGTQFGQTGSGAGNADDAAGWKANEIMLGQTVNDGTIVVSVDFIKQHRTNPLNEVDIALTSTSQGKTTSVAWTADWIKMAGSWTYGGGQLNTGIPTDIHAELTLNLVAGGTNTATLSFYEIGNPSNNGSLDLGSIVGTLNYDKIEIWGYTAGTKITGVDNVSVTPEPATMVLLASGALLAVLRRRK